MIAMKGLSWEEHATGVVFGFLRQIQQLAEEFPSSRFAFAWDSRKSFRKVVYPEYKRRTKVEDPEMEDLLNSGRPQFTEIRLKVLPRLGFKNNFIQVGLEADDIIAKIAQDYADKMDSIVIVSSDEDLFQLLTDNVSMYNPREKKHYTCEDFTKDKGITPKEWPSVKAIAGCSSDNVHGINGIGEKTIIKFIRNELKTGKKFDDIMGFDPTFNLSLVKLPHARTTPITLIDDKLNFSEFEGTCMDYGFASFLKKDVYNKWRGILCP